MKPKFVFNHEALLSNQKLEIFHLKRITKAKNLQTNTMTAGIKLIKEVISY